MPDKTNQQKKQRIPDNKLIETQVAKYKIAEKYYIQFSKKLEKILKLASKKYAPLAIVQSRAKTVSSFAGKITRKWEGLETEDPVTEFTDLCGVRVIALTESHHNAICTFIEKNFKIDQKNSLNARDRLHTTEFGYLSCHYIVSFEPGAFPSNEVNINIPAKLFPVKGRPMKAEIQVRTILQHAFAEITHDLCYKSSFDVPVKWQREVARVAAALETTSNEMEMIVAGIQDYAANYGGTLSREETLHEIKKLKVILKHDKKNAELAGRIARLAITLENWQEALDILQEFVDKTIPAACRDYGIAMIKQNQKKNDKKALETYNKGQAILAIAADLSNNDSDAMAAYASSWRRFDDVESIAKITKWYQNAYDANPTNTYALSNVIELEIIDRKNMSVVSLMKPAIATSIRHCLDQAEVGTNHPWAYYNAALFTMLLGQQNKGLGLLAKAAACSNAPFMLESACRSTERIRKALNKNRKKKEADLKTLEGLGHIRLLLAVLAKAKYINESKKDHSYKIAQCSPLKPSDPNLLLKSQGATIILAGACDEDSLEVVEKYKPLLMEAFANVSGSIISGGTTTGIPKLAGDIQRLYPDKIKTIGYLPRGTDADIIDRRYSRIILTDANDFSALEPIRYWHDILDANIDPETVRLVGIAGGDISAFEYRLALAMGAKVIMIEEGGCEAQALLKDVHWNNSPNLIVLPEEVLTLHYLIKQPTEQLSECIRDGIAEAIHETYRDAQKYQLAANDDAMQPWHGLPPHIKASNMEQADDIGEKVSVIKCHLSKVKKRTPASTSFSEAEVNLLSRMEHGRWTAQQLLSGWRYAPVKDMTKKTHPCIQKWDDLPESEKKKDVDAITAIPTILADFAYEIQR